MSTPEPSSTPAETVEPATGPEVEVKVAAEPKPEPKPTETVDFWKAKAREQETRAKANSKAAEELQAIKDSQKSDAERQADALAEAQREAAAARQESLRWRIATQHAISADDAELFLTGATEEQMTAQAKRLAETFAAQAAAAQQPQGLRPDPSQGARGGGSGDTAHQFEAAVSSLFL